MTGPVVFRGGRLAPTPERQRLFLGAHWEAGQVPSSPDRVDDVTPAAPYPMDGNDSWGDCTCADIAHRLQAASQLGTGTAVITPETVVLAAYSAITGFDPDAGPPGANPTDRGAVMQDVQSYWRKQGLGGHKSLVFAEVDVRNLDEVYAAINLFGGIDVGVRFPDTAMAQFDAGQPWDVVAGATVEGGHAVHVGGYDKTAGTFTLTTWGRVQAMTLAFWCAYVEEAWANILPEWLSQAGVSPTGLDLQGLGAAFAAVTGQPNPFPAPAPGPGPSPSPGPGPGPAPDPVPPAPGPGPSDLDAAALKLAQDPTARRFASHRHFSHELRHVAGLVEAVVQATPSDGGGDTANVTVFTVTPV